MDNPFIYGLRISFRRLLREKVYTAINVSGLAISMAAALLIFLYLQFESSYDQYHHEHENIYRLATDTHISGEQTTIAVNAVGLGPLMVDHFADFTSFTRIFPAGYFFRNITYRFQDKVFKENSVYGADSTFFDFFHFEFLEGSPETALTEPFSFVMTESMADRYFGQEKAVGRFIELEGAGKFLITAVISDPPLNSHLQFDGLFSISTMYQLDELLAMGFQPGVTWRHIENALGSRVIWLYLRATPGFDPDYFNENLWYPFHEKHVGPISENYDAKNIFQPVADIHLKSKLGYEMTDDTGVVTMMSPEIIRIFYIVAVFLLVIAAINYTNISISQFHHRGKEAGVKKIMGAANRNLVVQFFAEAILMAFIAFVLSIVILEITLPWVNHLLGTDLRVPIMENTSLIFVFLFIALLTGVFSGIYPALYFSSFSPLNMMRKGMTTGKKSLGLKKVLIVIQFAISIFMVIATLTVNKQLRYINNKDLGYNRENIIVLELSDAESRQSAAVLQNELMNNPYILDAALSNYIPSILTINNSMDVSNEDGRFSAVANIVQVTPEYLDFMGFELSAGRFFNDDSPNDFHEAVLINQTAQNHFRWDDPLGQEIEMLFNWPDGTPTGTRKVVGVVSDFHFTSLTKPIEPMVFYPMDGQARYLSMSISSAHQQEALEAIERAWSGFRPGYPLEYYFLNNLIDGFYTSQRKLNLLFTAFSFICIFIAFLGLYGLSAYSIKQRTREIGIRKVLGAANITIIRLLSIDFMKLIVFSAFIAGAAAWYFMTLWLQSFAYHTQMGPEPFIIGVVAAFAVAFLTIMIHAFRAATANPVVSIKHE